MNAFCRFTNYERHMPTAMTLCALIAVVGLTSLGCGRPQSWQFTLKAENGKAKIETDRFAIIFEGVRFDPAPGGTGGEATGSLAFAGLGKAVVSVSAGGKTFTNSYAGGVNTMTFAGHTMTLHEGGRNLKIGTQTFDLGAKKKTIVIRGDGSAAVKDGQVRELFRLLTTGKRLAFAARKTGMNEKSARKYRRAKHSGFCHQRTTLLADPERA